MRLRARPYRHKNEEYQAFLENEFVDVTDKELRLLSADARDFRERLNARDETKRRGYVRMKNSQQVKLNVT